jgi:hypothetical protein
MNRSWPILRDWGPTADHFGDVNEMIFHAVPTVETRQLSVLQNSLEVAIVTIAKHLGKVAAGPRFHPRIIRPADVLERGL